MKGKIATMMIVLVAIALLTGCAANPALYRNLPFPVRKIIKPGPVAVVTIKAEPAVSKLAVGQSVVLTATAQDENGRVVEGAQFTWKCDAKGKLSATKGKSVTFTLLKKPEVACFVEVKEAGGEEGIIEFEGK
ncbi:MAG: hypothetical protein U9R01_03210 [candidate division WOR-3 bacterium]|nr:hypothetical protein [candidate division WOR-3 bacterium]